MKTYTVKTILIFEADSPKEAAQKAIAHLQHKNGQTLFNVEWARSYPSEVIGKVLTVDHDTHEVTE